MTNEAHIYKMAYQQIEQALFELIDQCYDTHGKPRIPPTAALSAATSHLPADYVAKRIGKLTPPRSAA